MFACQWLKNTFGVVGHVTRFFNSLQKWDEKEKHCPDVCCPSFGRDNGGHGGHRGNGNMLPLLFSSPSSHFPCSNTAGARFTQDGMTKQAWAVASQRLPQWARWVPRRAGAGRWWCGCVPAVQPGAAACTHSAGTRKGRGCVGHSTLVTPTERVRQRQKTHLCFGIDFCRMLQKEVNNLYVSVVAANVQRSVSHLEWM